MISVLTLLSITGASVFDDSNANSNWDFVFSASRIVNDSDVNSTDSSETVTV